MQRNGSIVHLSNRGWAMNLILRAAGSAGVSLLLSATGFAQSRGGHVARPVQMRPAPIVAHPVVAARSFVAHAPVAVQTLPTGRAPIAAHLRSPHVTVINNGNSSRVATPRFEDADSSQVPGLGFDFIHLAAVNRGRNHRVHRAPFVTTPFFGFPFFSDFSAVPPAQAAPPQVIVVQQPISGQGEDADEEIAPRQARRNYSAPTAEASSDPEPLHEAGEYVIVKRDGGLAFAVAFSVQGGQLIYITREGLQHSMALSAVDLTATQQMNEQRGTPIHLPA